MGRPNEYMSNINNFFFFLILFRSLFLSIFPKYMHIKLPSFIDNLFSLGFFSPFNFCTMMFFDYVYDIYTFGKVRYDERERAQLLHIQWADVQQQQQQQ